MERVSVGVGGAGFGTVDIEVDHDRLLAAADDHRLNGLVRKSIHLLMRHERWDIDEVTGICFRDEFQMVAPAETGTPTHNVKNCFKFAVMVSAGERR